MSSSDIWVEKFRPKHVKDVVMPETYHKFFQDMLKEGVCKNILLYSSTPGSGKTSLAKAIVNDLQADCKYLNISAQRGIDTLRDEITAFATTQSFVADGKKIVICDEFDGATVALQQALRAAIETYENNCRFILTCNYVEKIIPALREGRLQMFDFNFQDEKFKKELRPKMIRRVSGTLAKQNVEYEQDAVEWIVDNNYPSLRKMISLVSKIASMYGKVTMENISTSETTRQKLYKKIEEKDLTGAREFVIKNSMDVGELYSQMWREWVNGMDIQVQAQIIPILNACQYQHNFVIDPELNFADCVLKIIGVLYSSKRGS